jgi:hypothetical protein
MLAHKYVSKLPPSEIADIELSAKVYRAVQDLDVTAVRCGDIREKLFPGRAPITLSKLELYQWLRTCLLAQLVLDEEVFQTLLKGKQ